MKRFAWGALVLLVLCPPAEAGSPKAKITGHGDYSWLDTESVPCSIMLESVLRDRGFEVIERTRPDSDASLVITVGASCSGIWYPYYYRRWYYRRPAQSQCSTWAKARGRAVRNFSMRGKGDSNTGHLSALSAACRQMATRLDKALGGKGNIDDVELNKSGPGKIRIRVVVQWKGEMQPMPLITLTNFFNKAGYKAKLVKGGAHQCSFKVTIQEQRERFQHLLTTYLESRYQVRLTKNSGARMVFRLARRKAD